ncbi:hypothetical protein ACFE04_017259 [Oxalis oulophora]
MAKCHRNDVGSLTLDRPSTTTTSHFKQWSRPFTKATLRRLIFDAVSCGASSRYSHRHNNNNQPTSPTTTTTTTTTTTSVRSILNDKKTEKLFDLLNLAEAESEAETMKKVEALEQLKKVVKVLQMQLESEDEEEGKDVILIKRKSKAASDVRLLAKEDSKVRVTLAMLGAIPPLVGMLNLDNDSDDAHIASLYALLNLGIANDGNKAAIVKAGAVHKMLKLIESPNSLNPSVSEAIIANFLGLSALDANKPVIGSSGVIPFLVKTIDGKSSSQAKQDALRALYNLSIFPPNVSFILETDWIQLMFNSLGDMEVSERILSILSNIVSTPEGRRAVGIFPEAFPILVDVLNWTDSPGCQEKASYILMVLAHKTYGDRQAMIEAGVVSSLLELTLIGTTLAQKRASRILECLRVDKGKQVSENFSLSAAVSAPIYGSCSSMTNPDGVVMKECLGDEDMMSAEKKAVKQLVQQSLQNNMKRIVKRANLPQDFAPSEHFKTLTASSTSKSLPF